MSFTIEDMKTIAQDKYEMEIIGGNNGWSNSISWILLMEDSRVLEDFKGKDLAVTTGLGFDTEEKLLELVTKLVERHASGLVVNTGRYIHTIPNSVIEYCNANNFPLLTVPWQTSLYEMIKDLSMRVFLQSAVDEQISQALIHVIKEPGTAELYKKDLLPYFDVDGTFQMVLISTGDLDIMDTVERMRISHRMQIYLENLTHNGHFLYYDSCFAVVVNALTVETLKDIIDGFLAKLRRRMPGRRVSVGVGSMVTDISNLQLAYNRARAAVDIALRTGQDILWFDDMGIFRLLSQVTDERLLREMGEDTLRPLIEYDKQHNTAYVETLQYYLENERSIQTVAQKMYTHRNTIIYRINNIKKLLDCDMESSQERLKYLLACIILKM